MTDEELRADNLALEKNISDLKNLLQEVFLRIKKLVETT